MKKALLVIDYINGIAKNGSCANYLKQNPQVIHNTNHLIQVARENNVAVIHIRLAFDKDYTGLPTHAPGGELIRAQQKFQLGSEETEFLSELDVKEGDIVLNKKYGDPFYGNNLLELLQKNEIQTLIFTGVSTDNAILNGVNTAMLNGFYIIVVTDACGATSENMHEQALAIIQGRTTNECLDTKQTLALLRTKN